ncbi:MAG: hypothetical protein ACKOAD_00225 [Gammaproteobacteria bacterium]
MSNSVNQASDWKKKAVYIGGVLFGAYLLIQTIAYFDSKSKQEQVFGLVTSKMNGMSAGLSEPSASGVSEKKDKKIEELKSEILELNKKVSNLEASVSKLPSIKEIESILEKRLPKSPILSERSERPIQPIENRAIDEKSVELNAH